MDEPPDRFWGVSAADVLRQLDTTPGGLGSADAARRLDRVGPNVLQSRRHAGELVLLLGQFKSPLILILLFAAGLSFVLHDPADALIIFVIVLASGVLEFWQERGAAHAVDRLLAVVQAKTTVLRDGAQNEVAVAEVGGGERVGARAAEPVHLACHQPGSSGLFIFRLGYKKYSTRWLKVDEV